METKQPDSNIVSLDWKRRQVREKSSRANRAGQYGSPLERRVAELETEMDRVIGILLDTADLAEKNRDYLMILLRQLKERRE